MAIIKCPECGRQISDKAPTCPSCGVEIAGKITKCPNCGEVYFSNLEMCPNCHEIAVGVTHPAASSAAVKDPHSLLHLRSSEYHSPCYQQEIPVRLLSSSNSYSSDQHLLLLLLHLYLQYVVL